MDQYPRPKPPEVPPFDPNNWEDVLQHVLLACFVLFMIIMPRFCCSVSNEDFAKFKKEYQANLQRQLHEAQLLNAQHHKTKLE